MKLTAEMKNWCLEHYEEACDLLRKLGRIPAPSHNEQLRAEFVRDWLVGQGSEGVIIDDALNVIYPVNCTPGKQINVLMAHTDIVFPDTDPLEMHEADGRLYAPGIGDDTANLVTLLMASKYIAQHGFIGDKGLLIVANSCEEGLGNLKGSRQIMTDYSDRIAEFISIDGGVDSVVNNAVGSCRMRITIKAQGGHSYGAFGNTNAIVQMAELIRRLYEKEPPKKAKTTYNVGVIEGGTTVNTICAECSILYEYRSEDRECLAEMNKFFCDTIDAYRDEGIEVSVEVLGERPCKGDVDEAALTELTGRMQTIVSSITGKTVISEAGSTDANTALAKGVPAVTIGAIVSYGAHTRGEWVELESLKNGIMIALATAMQYV